MRSNVGAGLLAKAVCQAIHEPAGPPLSQASQLPQLIFSVLEVFCRQKNAPHLAGHFYGRGLQAVEHRLVTYRTLVGTGSQQGISLQRGRHFTWTLLDRFPAFLVLFDPACSQFFIADQQVDRAVRNVDQHFVAILHQANRATGSGFWRSVTDGQARGAAGEATVGEQRTGFAQAFGFQVGRRVQHFLHARAAFRTFVTDDHDVAGLHFVSEDAAYGAVLAFEDLRVAFEHVDRLVDAGGFHHAAVQGDIAVEHGQAAFFRIGVLDTADAAVFTVVVEGFPTGRLAERGLGRDTGGTGLEEGVHRFIAGLGDVPLGDALGQGLAVHGRQVGVQQAATGQFAEDAEDPAGAVHVFHMVLLDVRRDLAQLRHVTGQAVDVVQVEIDLGFLGGSQQVQDGVGGTAHGDVQGHGVFERLDIGNIARQHRVIVVAVVTLAQLDDGPAGLEEQLLAVGVGRQGRTVARQGEAQGFGEAVHRVGGEHAGARTARRASAALVLGNLLVRSAGVGGDDHGVHQVEAVGGQFGLAGFHRAAGNEDHRDVQAQGGHQHAGGDLVAVGDADDGVGAVGVDHVFDGVGDDLAARQRIEHAIVAHGDAVIHGDGVEFLGDTAGPLDFTGDQLAKVLEVDVARYELGERVGDGDDRFLEVGVFHPRGAPQGAGTGHVAAVGGCFRAVIRHGALRAANQVHKGK